jgi:hypothetical protein
MQELNCAVFHDINPIPMKYMMMRMGLMPNEAHRLPLVPSTPELRGGLDTLIAIWSQRRRTEACQSCPIQSTNSSATTLRSHLFGASFKARSCQY